MHTKKFLSDRWMYGQEMNEWIDGLQNRCMNRLTEGTFVNQCILHIIIIIITIIIIIIITWLHVAVSVMVSMLNVLDVCVPRRKGPVYHVCRVSQTTVKTC